MTAHLPLTKPAADKGAMLDALRALFEPGDVIELRALHKGKKRTDAGYFDADHWPQLVAHAERLNNQGAAVYVTLNPVNTQLLGRYNNRMQDYADSTATDADIVMRRWLLVDIDPKRPKNTSATPAQFEAAQATARHVYQHLAGCGWPAPIVGESGNGMHLLYPLALPNDTASRDLVKAALQGLAARFDTDMVNIDVSVFNAGRITKLYGTVSNKGDHTDAAPWRLSRLVSVPERGDAVTVEQLREVAQLRADDQDDDTADLHHGGNIGRFDLPAFLGRLGIGYDQDTHEGSDRYKLHHCPFNPEHGYGESAVFRSPSGALAFKCLHNTCVGNDWRKLRELVDGPRESRTRPQADISGLMQGLHQHQHESGVAGRSGGAESIPSIALTPITPDELQRARLTPRIVLDDMLYADVRTRISGGGTGKTTVALFEAATLALGRELWGRTPEGPRKTVIVTREDGREILVARLREIAHSMWLDAGELAQVMENVNVLDLTSEAFRLSRVVGDVVYPHTENIDALVAALQPWAPDWVIFDPLVSFGVGESRINDAEQGLIEAFRIIRNRLDCCVEGIHHSGKANAKEKALDQYAGRGGSALADGCRMVAVMQPLDPKEWREATGAALELGESGLVMALPKLSYAKSQQPIFIKRAGYRFMQATVIKRTPEQQADAVAEQVMQFIRHEYDQGRRYSTADLENSREKMGLSRDKLRSAITALKVEGRVVYHEIRGKAGSHYEPVSLADDTRDTHEETAPAQGEGSRANYPRGSIGKEDGGDTCRPSIPLFSESRGEASARLRDTRDGTKWELPEGAENMSDKELVYAMTATPLPPSAEAGLRNLGAMLSGADATDEIEIEL